MVKDEYGRMKMPHQVLFGKNESSSEACNCGEKYPRIPHPGRLDLLLGQRPWSWAVS